MKPVLFAAMTCVLLTASPTTAATTFDLETTGSGTYFRSLTVFDIGLGMTVTTEGFANGYLNVRDPNVALLGLRAVTGQQTAQASFGTFAPLRFTFDELIDSVTFNYGDAGGDSDSPVVIEAFSTGGTLLGSATAGYGENVATGGSLTLNFAGARYFIASSGVGTNNPHSLLWDIGAITKAGTAGAVPEPATWALMMLGFGAMGAALRRRPTTQARIRFA